jgi:FixJ family two-component response regulator
MKFDETVYVVDDDPAVLDAVDEMVRGAGLRSKCFRDPEEFLRSVSNADIGCLILDVRIPGIDGFEILARLKTKQCRLQAIMITGYGDVPMTVRALKMGALTFLEKPFKPRELLAEVRNAIATAKQGPATTLTYKLIQLDLTQSEYAIMSGLMRGLTDAELADEVDVSRRTIQLRKSRLFRKFGVRTRREFLEGLVDRESLSERADSAERRELRQ